MSTPRCCPVYCNNLKLYPNTEQIAQDGEEEIVIAEGTIYAITQAEADCIALELAEAELFDELCILSVPLAFDQELSTSFATPVEVTLTGESPLGGELIYTVTVDPVFGVLSGTSPDLIYTPDPVFSGVDTFEFTVNDGFNTSLPGTVDITVGIGALPQSLDVNFELATAITLSGYPDPDTMVYTVTVEPLHGTLTGTGRNRTYTPDEGYEGPDSFEFTVTREGEVSEPATVSITVLEAGKFYADYITLQYQFSDGLDLDTRTQLISPLIGEEVGWCQGEQSYGPLGELWYEWAGDNTGTGFESVLFYVGQIRTEYPGTVIAGVCQAWWYNERVSGDVNLQLKAYSGGTMVYIDGEFRWENVGGTEVASLAFPGNVAQEDGECVSNAECITQFLYNTEDNLFDWLSCD